MATRSFPSTAASASARRTTIVRRSWFTSIRWRAALSSALVGGSVVTTVTGRSDPASALVAGVSGCIRSRYRHAQVKRGIMRACGGHRRLSNPERPHPARPPRRRRWAEGGDVERRDLDRRPDRDGRAPTLALHQEAHRAADPGPSRVVASRPSGSLGSGPTCPSSSDPRCLAAWPRRRAPAGSGPRGSGRTAAHARACGPSRPVGPGLVGSPSGDERSSASCGRPAAPSGCCAWRRSAVSGSPSTTTSLHRYLPFGGTFLTFRQPGRQRLDDILLEPAEVDEHHERGCAWVVLRKALLGELLGDVESGAEDQPKVVDGGQPRRDLLLGQLGGVDGPLHRRERVESLPAQLGRDQALVLGLPLRVIAVRGREQPAEGGVIGPQQVPELPGERAEQFPFLRRHPRPVPVAAGALHARAWKSGHLSRDAWWPTGRGRAVGSTSTRIAPWSRWPRRTDLRCGPAS